MNLEDVAALVAGSPFAERLDRGAPLMVAAGGPARVEFATPAALALFGVETLGALDAIALQRRAPAPGDCAFSSRRSPTGRPRAWNRCDFTPAACLCRSG